MKAIEKQTKPKGSGAGRRIFTLTRRDHSNLREVAETFRAEERREPSASLLIGAGLQMLRRYAEKNGAPSVWIEGQG